MKIKSGDQFLDRFVSIYRIWFLTAAGPADANKIKIETSPRAKLCPPQRSKVHGACPARGAPKTTLRKSWCHPGAPEARSLDPCRASFTFGGASRPPKMAFARQGVKGFGHRSPDVAPGACGFGHLSRATGAVDLTSPRWTQLSTRTGSASCLHCGGQEARRCTARYHRFAVVSLSIKSATVGTPRLHETRTKHTQTCTNTRTRKDTHTHTHILRGTRA